MIEYFTDSKLPLPRTIICSRRKSVRASSATQFSQETKRWFTSAEVQTGYVWVLTSMDRVYYFYKPSREISFLQEMLAPFKEYLYPTFTQPTTR